MHIVYSPLVVAIPRVKVEDKRFILNLNNYRNTNYFTLNKAKVIYKQIMKKQILTLPKFYDVDVVFVNYPKTKAIPDTPNVCSIHDKFFMDALVEFGKLPDDKPLHHVSSKYLFGAVDKNNPRVAICLRKAVPLDVGNL